MSDPGGGDEEWAYDPDAEPVGDGGTEPASGGAPSAGATVGAGAVGFTVFLGTVFLMLTGAYRLALWYALVMSALVLGWQAIAAYLHVRSIGVEE